MEDLSDVYVTDYIPTIYTSPRTLTYNQDGRQQSADFLAERNGVIIVVYNVTRDVLVLVRQFRPAAYLQSIPEDDRKIDAQIDTEKYPASLGVTLEFCAGLEDKNIPTEEIAREEILEECGYDVDVSQLERVGTFKNLTETTGARTTMFYCQVTDDMKTSGGGGVDGENVQVVEMPFRDVYDYVHCQKRHVNSPANFLYAFYWFMYNKHSK